MSLILGIIGLLVIVSALLSRATERGPISRVIVFVLLGLGLGAVGLFRFPVDASGVVAIGVITLTLTLFTDAIKMQTEQLRQDWAASLAVLGPGTILTALLIAASARLILGMGPLHSLLLGAILASTDAALLRDVLRDQRTPEAVRQILTIEAGTNDLVALPAVLILIELIGGRLTSWLDWAGFALPVFLLSPAVGIVIALVAIHGLAWVDRRIGVRRDYQSLYSLGVALTAFAAAELVHGSGLLAAFAAGLTIAVSDLDLCECFLEYGETTAELTMLVTFVLFGSTLVHPALVAFDWRVALFALVILFVCRPVALLLVLNAFRLPQPDRIVAAFVGPRGLNSVLLALLVLVSGAPGGERVFSAVGAVVLASVFIHGLSAKALVAWAARAPAAEITPDRPEFRTVPRISPEELSVMLERGEPVTVVDVRKPGDLDRDPRTIPGAIHLPPDEAPQRLLDMRPQGPLVLYCA